MEIYSLELIDHDRETPTASLQLDSGLNGTDKGIIGRIAELKKINYSELTEKTQWRIFRLTDENLLFTRRHPHDAINVSVSLPLPRPEIGFEKDTSKTGEPRIKLNLKQLGRQGVALMAMGFSKTYPVEQLPEWLTKSTKQYVVTIEPMNESLPGSNQPIIFANATGDERGRT